MNTYFENKVFLVTGASSGIGRSLAAGLASAGSEVICMARSIDALEQLRDECGPRIHPFQGDATQQEACKTGVEQAIKLNGTLDGIIHSAGITMRALAEDCQLEVYRKTMEINFFALLHLYAHGLSHLKATHGHFVAISSVMGRYSTQLRSGYCASKHAVQGFMDSVRIENQGSGIHCLVVSPGFVRTRVALNALNAEAKPVGQDSKVILNGLDPDVVASSVLKAIYHRKRDLYPAGTKEKLGLFLSKWAPGLLDRLLRRLEVT